MTLIARHRTALDRTELSRPMRLALEDGLISTATRVLDYGCGRGGDVEQLRARGINCNGWDPVHFPHGPREEADVVNIGYVINVIEDLPERAEVLRSAHNLCTKVLVVAARLEAEARPSDRSLHQDGYITRLGTFQKLYQQHELRSFIEQTLGVQSAPAGPGVFYVFRDESARQSFFASRYRRIGLAPRIRKSDALYEQHKERLRPLLEFIGARGRLPQPEELDGANTITEIFGSIGRAFRVLKAVVDDAQWTEVQTQRTHDLLIYIALSRFSRRPRLTDLPADLKNDIRAFFTSYQAACELADAMLFSAGDMAVIDRLCRESKVGKITPGALYVHEGALGELAPVLRIYEGCARAFIGTVEGANIIKLHRGAPQISYLSYPEFDKDPHPALHSSLVVPLQTFRVDLRFYDASKNPPILHRKEEFVTATYPLREKFARLTAQEVRYGLYTTPERIGTRQGWIDVLQERRVTLRGHRVVELRP